MHTGSHSLLVKHVFLPGKESLQEKKLTKLVEQDEGSYPELWTPITPYRLVWIHEKCCCTIKEEKRKPKHSPSPLIGKLLP